METHVFSMVSVVKDLYPMSTSNFVILPVIKKKQLLTCTSDHKIYGWNFRHRITFLGQRLGRVSILSMCIHFIATESFQSEKASLKVKPYDFLIRTTNSSEKNFLKKMLDNLSKDCDRGAILLMLRSFFHFKQKACKWIFPFVTEYCPSVPIIFRIF